MMSAIESTSAGSGYARRTLALKLGARATAVAAKLRELAPYALIELILPGGSVMALMLWLYRRQRRAGVSRAAGSRALVRGPLGCRPVGTIAVDRAVLGMQVVRAVGNVEADARSLA